MYAEIIFVHKGEYKVLARKEAQYKEDGDMMCGRDYKACGGSLARKSDLRLLVAVIAVMAFAGAIWMGLNDVRYASLRRWLDACKTETVHVTTGDTLWSIASTHGARGTSTYEVVEWIKERNGLTTSELKPGTRILVPLVTTS